VLQTKKTLQNAAQEGFPRPDASALTSEISLFFYDGKLDLM